MEERNITQASLCKELGMSRGAFACAISRESLPSADRMLQIAKALDASMEFLLTGVEPQSQASEDPRKSVAITAILHSDLIKEAVLRLEKFPPEQRKLVLELLKSMTE